MFDPSLRSPKEKPLFVIGAVLSGLVWIGLVISLVGLAYIAIFALFGWAALSMALARIRGNAVRVSERQLPELHARCVAAAHHLGLAVTPEVYVTQANGVLNAFAVKLLSRNFVVLHSEVIEKSADPRQVDFVIAHEMGHHAAGHLRWRTFLLPYMMVPWLGPAYSRACEYTCDRCGLAFVGDEEAAMRGLLLLSVGGLAPRVSIDAYLAQRLETEGFWAGIYELVSTHPFITRRVAALRAVRSPHEATTQRHPLSYVFAPLFGIAAGTPAAAGMILMVYLGILAAVAIPAFTRYVKRSKTSEAAGNIARIYQGELAYLQASIEAQRGASFVALPSTPPAPPSAQKYPANVQAWGQWTPVGFSIDAAHYYQYSVSADATSFTVRAVGDLDGDGIQSTFERTGRIEGGELMGSQIQITNELE